MNLHASDTLKGFLDIFFSAFCYATLPILCKMAYAANLEASSILFLRFFFSLILLITYIKVFRHTQILTTSPVVLLQGLMFTIGGLAYFYAVKHLSAGLTNVIFFAHPIIVIMLAVILFKDKIQVRLLIGLLLAMAGIYIISVESGGLSISSSPGVIWALVSCVAYAFYSLLCQIPGKNNDPLTIIASILLVGLGLLTVVFWNDLGFIMHLTLQQVLIATAMALINTLLAVIFFLRGIQRIGIAKASLVSTVELPISLIMAFFILGEILTVNQTIGSILVFASMMLAVYPNSLRKGSDLSATDKRLPK